MTVMPKVLWKNGVRYGSEWVELEIGPDFTGTVLFKNNKNGTATLQGYLSPVRTLYPNTDVVLFVPPKGIKFDADESQKLSFNGSSSQIDYSGQIALKPLGSLQALHGNVVGLSLYNQDYTFLGLNRGTAMTNGLTIKIQKG